MTTTVIIVGLSIIVQLVAAIFSLRLIRITGQVWAWACISIPLFLMAFRRLFTLLNDIFHSTGQSHYETTADIFSLVISCCTFVGVLCMRKVFLDMRRNNEELHGFREHLTNMVEERTRELQNMNKQLGNEIVLRREIEQDLIHARDVAEAANQSKNNFLANVTHELRTPLNSIIGFSQILGDPTLSPTLSNDHKKYADIIADNGQRLLHLIDNILDLTKIESDKFPLEPDLFHVSELLEASKGMCAQLAAGKNITLNLFIPEDCPAMLADGPKLRHALVSLLDNAIKFTPAGGRISVTVIFRDDGGEAPPQHEFFVSDTGPGIKPEHHENIFDKFFQVDSSSTRKHEGTGLGLSLTKKIIELHGGKIRVESEGVPGKGSTFHFTIPLYKKTQRPAQGDHVNAARN